MEKQYPPMTTVTTNVTVHAPVIGLNLKTLENFIDTTIKVQVGPSAPGLAFESNVVLDIPTSFPSFRVYPMRDIDINTVNLFIPVDISYDYCYMKVGDNVEVFCITVPNAIQDAIQDCIKKVCSGVRVGIGTINFAKDEFCRMLEPDNRYYPLVPFNFDKKIRFIIEKHLEDLLPKLRSKL